MNPFNIFVISALAIVFATQTMFQKNIIRVARSIFFLGAVYLFGKFFWDSFSFYKSWKGGALTQFFLPPYRDLNYFYHTIGNEFIFPLLLALLAAIIIPRVAERLNKKYEERFFYQEEFWLMRLGLLFIGYPGFIFYVLAVFVFNAGFSGIYSLLDRGRATMRYFWMPVGVLTIVLINWFLPPEILKPFTF